MNPTPHLHAFRRLIAPVTLIVGLMVCATVSAADDKAKDHPGYVDGSSFVDLIDEDGRLIEVSLDRKLLRLFSGRAMKKRMSVIADILGDLVAINAVIGEVTELREESNEEIERMQSRLERDGWERFVRVREPEAGDFSAWIHADKEDEEMVDGLVVIGFQEDHEMMFVNLCGRIDMENIAMLGDEMGLPGLGDLPPKSEMDKRREEEKRQRGDASEDDNVIAPRE